MGEAVREFIAPCMVQVCPKGFTSNEVCAVMTEAVIAAGGEHLLEVSGGCSIAAFAEMVAKPQTDQRMIELEASLGLDTSVVVGGA